jgi:hypothetical protein
VAILDGDPEIDAFITRRLELVADEYIAANQLFQAWKDACAEHRREPGSKIAFCYRIRKRVKHEPNSGRPRYVGVRFKTAEAPHLRVASA